MSDGFDKEAEREKLREKLADDDEKREHTQRMSELLLQGATMTNRHCDDCGDPIFRNDGQEFCPTCQATGPGTGAQGDSQEATQATAGNDRQPQGGARTAPASPAAEQSPNTSDAGQNATGQTATAPNAAASPSSNAARSGEDPSATPPTAISPTESAGSGTVADARASLTRTLARFARAAEETDDPRRARDHLQAAREAAEALAALD